MSEIKKGNRVTLKSGGPVMTVQRLADYSLTDDIEEGVLCVWFDGNTAMEKVFDIDALVVYQD